MTEKLKQLQVRLDQIRREVLMDPKTQAWIACLNEALAAGKAGNYPVGALIVDGSGAVISRVRNEVFKPKFRSDAHAEMTAISAYECGLGTQTSDLTLFSTLEPCLMCTARIVLSDVSKVVFLMRDPTAGICDRFDTLPPNYRDLGARVSFSEYQGDSELKAIARELYETGEEIWAREYQLGKNT